MHLDSTPVNVAIRLVSKTGSFLDRQLPYSPQIKFSLRAPTADAFGDFWPELLVEAEPPLCQVVRVKSIGQLIMAFRASGNAPPNELFSDGASDLSS